MIQALEAEPTADALEQLAENRDSIEMALNKLSQEEAMAVRMYHLEGKTYREIGLRMGMAENSIGPYLTRARAKMREMLSS
jgi:RNA polymerase sigma-70 factor (ECF subfamily)